MLTNKKVSDILRAYEEDILGIACFQLEYYQS